MFYAFSLTTSLWSSFGFFLAKELNSSLSRLITGNSTETKIIWNSCLPVFSSENSVRNSVFNLFFSKEKPWNFIFVRISHKTRPDKHGRVVLITCKRDLSSVMYSSEHRTSHFLQGTRTTRPWLKGHPVDYQTRREWQRNQWRPWRWWRRSRTSSGCPCTSA